MPRIIKTDIYRFTNNLETITLGNRAEICSQVGSALDTPPTINSATFEDALHGEDMNGWGGSHVGISIDPTETPENNQPGIVNGIFVFDGALLGRRGSFRASVSGTVRGARMDIRLTIIPGSVTGQLKGLEGKGDYIVIKPPTKEEPIHATWVVDAYWLGPVL